MAGTPAESPPPEDRSREALGRARRTPAQREGPVLVERVSKDDGRALILYTVVGEPA